VGDLGRAAVGFVRGRSDAERREQFVVTDEQRGGGRAEQADDLAQDVRGHLGRRGLGDQSGREPVEGGRLVLAGQRPRLAIAHAPRLQAHDHADHEEGKQREVVLGLAHSQRVIGRQKEEVPGKEGQHGRQDGGAGAAGAGHQHDDQQVEQRPLAFGKRASAGQEDRRRRSDRQDC
jgi:hypothetical protein